MGLDQPAHRSGWTLSADRCCDNGFGTPARLDASRRERSRPGLEALHSAELTRKIAHDYPPGDPTELRWAQFGIPFHEGGDPCFIDAGKGGRGGVFQRINDGEPLLDPVAPSFTEYFESWLGAGCYAHGNGDVKVFWKYWERVRDLVPVQIEPSRNGWLLHHGRRYENPKFPGTGAGKKPTARK